MYVGMNLLVLCGLVLCVSCFNVIQRSCAIWLYRYRRAEFEKRQGVQHGLLPLCQNYKHVVHIDADAFLLGRINAVYQKHPETDTVIGFDDGTDSLSNLEVLFQVKKPADFSDTAYAFNAGIVFYVNGPNVKQLMRDFMFYITIGISLK